VWGRSPKGGALNLETITLALKNILAHFWSKTKTQASNSLAIILNLNLQYQKVTEKAKGYEFEERLQLRAEPHHVKRELNGFTQVKFGHRFSQISTDIRFFVVFNILVIRDHPCLQKGNSYTFKLFYQ
jgi:hypothetical protein